ncbi:hypothetical protein [Pseudomonas sp. Teo4]|uniref:hypothetical protein n=1 Tax=Pseudomonas sp. Teo4 TaxID=3064528 RepID=UPI002AB90D33|nr:hypothetical protein [Pseudomonas sp. Teo4]MDZ3991768.1 hypothetical protein [Pseudomonas sp. Teo4]
MKKPGAAKKKPGAAEKKPGELDPDYGKDGVSIVPAEFSGDETYTLQIEVCVKNTIDDSMVFVGHNPPQDGSGAVPWRPLFFTRIDKNGKWDESLRHVKLPETGMEEYGIIRSLNYITLDGRGRYLASFVYRYGSAGNIVYHAAIHAFDENFKPIGDFGENGMIYLKHPDYPQKGSKKPQPKLNPKKSTTGNVSETEQCPNSSKPENLDYRFESKLDLVDGKIKIIFSGLVMNSTGLITNSTLCALLNPHTGELVAGLGEKGDKSQIALPVVADRVFIPYRVEFLKDGSFLIAGFTTDKNEPYLVRFNSNATLDENFGDGGKIRLAGAPLHTGLAVFKNTIVVSTAPFHAGSDPTQLYGFTLSGKVLPQFTKEIRSPSFTKGHKKNAQTGISLHHIKFDPAGRLVLAGNIIDEHKFSYLQIARLSADGTLDESFGKGGFSDPKKFDYLYSSHGIYLLKDAINIFSWMDKSLVQRHDRIARFTA